MNNISLLARIMVAIVIGLPLRDTDRYGRKLRIVVRNGASIGEALVAEGLAREWGGARHPWCV